MGSSSRLCLLAAPDDPWAQRVARLLGVPVYGRGRSLVRARPDVVIVRLPVAQWERAAFACTVAGVGAVIGAPKGPPSALPWWGRRYHRVLVDSQDEARAWLGVGVPLGRVVVVAPSDDMAAAAGLRSVIEEVTSMARRPDARAPAR